MEAARGAAEAAAGERLSSGAPALRREEAETRKARDSVATPWARFSLPGDEPAYARGGSEEFRRSIRQIFGPLVEVVTVFPSGALAWVMSEVPAQGSLGRFFADLEGRLTPAGSAWVVFPKKPFARELAFGFTWSDVAQAGLAAGLVDNKVAAFSTRLTSLRFVIPVGRRAARRV